MCASRVMVGEWEDGRVGGDAASPEEGPGVYKTLAKGVRRRKTKDERRRRRHSLESGSDSDS